ncbi:hypothetical protein T492DRAFT_912883, partial [Pavlovales sp. CCMP2436]
MSSTAVAAVLLACAAVTAGEPPWESLVGDPGMMAEYPRLMTEAWSFCNRACAHGDSSCAVSPRWADCAADNGPGPHGNRVTLADEALGAALHESSDEAAVRKEQLLARRCAEPFTRAPLGEHYFWTAMIKSGNAIDVEECGIGGGQCAAYYSQGTAPHLPIAEADEVAHEAAAEAARPCALEAVRSGSSRANGDGDRDGHRHRHNISETLAPSARVPSPTGGAQPCSAFPRPWYANRLPVHQPSVTHHWSQRSQPGGHFRGGFEATYGNGSRAAVSWLWSDGDGGKGAPSGRVYSCELRTSTQYPWLMLYLGADAARGLKGGAAYDGRGMLAHSAAEAETPLEVRYAVRLLQLSPRGSSSFYLLNLGACWTLSGGSCTGNTRRDVTRYVLLDISGPSLCAPSSPSNCPLAHRFANGSLVRRSELSRFPYAAYGVDVSALALRLVFAGAPPTPAAQRWSTINVGAETGIPGVSAGAGGAVARWQLAEMDVRAPRPEERAQRPAEASRAAGSEAAEAGAADAPAAEAV